MNKEKENKFRHPSYTGMFILVLAVVLLFGLTIWQCAKINTLYKANIRKVEEISTALQELENYANDAAADTEDSQQRIVINITYPAVLESDDISLEGLISMVQAENAEALENFNNYIVIFSILITVVVIVIPIFNYTFIQKDQIRRLDEQYDAFDERFKKMNARFGGEIKRLENAIEESHGVSSSLIPDKVGRESADIKPISDKPEDRARALVLSARLDFIKERYNDAIQKISDAICLAKNHAEYYNTRSFMYHQRKMYGKALIDANMAIELEPGNAGYYNNRGTTLHEMGRYEEALADKTKAIELEPGNAGYYNNRGTTLHEMGRYEEALADKTKAIELEPENARYYNNRGVTLHEMGKYEEALADETKAIELEPGNAGYYDSRGTTLHKMGRYEEALTDATKAIELEPGNAGYYDSRGTTLHKMGRYEEALADKTKAIELEPGNARYYNNRGATLHALKRYEAALADATKAIELEPGNAGYYDSRGTTLHEMGRYEEALADKTKAIELEPGNAEYYNNRGVTLHALKRYEEALADATKAIELEPGNAGYYNSRGVTLHSLKRYKEALADETKAIKLEPGNAGYYDNRAITYFRMKDYPKALIDAKKAYSIDSSNTRYKYNLARVLCFSGLPEDAFEYIREIPKECDYASAFRTRALTKIRLKHRNKEEVTEDFVKEVTADLERATKIDSGNVYSFIDFAIAMLLLEKPQEAFEKLEAAKKIDPEEPEVYHWYAEYYRKTGDTQKAAEYDRIADEKGYIPEPDDT